MWDIDCKVARVPSSLIFVIINSIYLINDLSSI
jgi:hypothetical protein